MAENTTASSNNNISVTAPPNQSHNESYAFHIVIVEAVLMLPTIIGNSLILASIIKYAPLRTRGHILVASLAVADLLVGVIMIPWDLAFYATPELGKIKFLCLYRHSISVTFVTATLINLLAISAERFIATVFPLFYASRITKGKMVAVGVATWIWPLVIGFSPLLGWNAWKPGIPCGIGIWSKLYSDIMLYSLVAFLWLNIIFYSKVAYTVWKRTTRVQASKTDPKVQSQIKKDMVRTKLMLLVFFIFLLCWGPFLTLVVFWVPLKLYLQPEHMTVRRFLLLLGIANSSLNWIVYGLKNKDFRKAFAMLLGRRRDPLSGNELSTHTHNTNVSTVVKSNTHSNVGQEKC